MSIRELEMKQMRVSMWESRGEILSRNELEEEYEDPNVDYINLEE